MIKQRTEKAGRIIISMADDARGDDDEIFVYMGGNQQVPNGVRRARIHKSVKIVRANAFENRRRLIYVEFHDGIEIIEEFAFCGCFLLSGAIKLLGVKIIKDSAFDYCYGVTDVEFGDRLETIEMRAFHYCTSLTKIRMPTVRTIGRAAFGCCQVLTDVQCGGGLRTLHSFAFHYCPELKRIALPLNDGIIGDNNIFYDCPKLRTVDIVGGTHQTVASLHLESWRNEMNNEINRINQVLPTFTHWHKTEEIQQWMTRVIDRLDLYKAEHHKLMMKEATTLLELALWKANLDENGGDRIDREGVRVTRGSRKRARKEICVTSGADVVIKNVLPFLALK